VSEVVTDDGYALILPRPLLLEAGDHYWIDFEGPALVIERDGRQTRHVGDMETRP
jgi:hypothetical protein